MRRAIELGGAVLATLLVGWLVGKISIRPPSVDPLINAPAEDMVLLPPGSMLERIDSLRIFPAGAPDQPITWPTTPGEELQLAADIYWRQGMEPEVWARVWNLTACVQGEVDECRRQWEYVDLDPYTGTLRLLRTMPDPDRLGVSLGIAVGSRAARQTGVT